MKKNSSQSDFQRVNQYGSIVRDADITSGRLRRLTSDLEATRFKTPKLTSQRRSNEEVNTFFCKLKAKLRRALVCEHLEGWIYCIRGRWQRYYLITICRPWQHVLGATKWVFRFPSTFWWTLLIKARSLTCWRLSITSFLGDGCCRHEDLMELHFCIACISDSRLLSGDWIRFFCSLA